MTIRQVLSAPYRGRRSPSVNEVGLLFKEEFAFFIYRLAMRERERERGDLLITRSSRLFDVLLLVLLLPPPLRLLLLLLLLLFAVAVEARERPSHAGRHVIAALD